MRSLTWSSRAASPTPSFAPALSWPTSSDRERASRTTARHSPKLPQASLVFGDDLSSNTGRNIHKGTKLLLEGLMLGVRNIFAHHRDRFAPEEPAELITLCSLLARRVDDGGVREHSP